MTSVSHATRPSGSSRQHRIQHRVGDLVGDLVGVAFGHGLRGEHHVARHRRGSLRRSTPRGSVRERPHAQPRTGLKRAPPGVPICAHMNRAGLARRGRRRRRHRAGARRAAAPGAQPRRVRRAGRALLRRLGDRARVRRRSPSCSGTVGVAPPRPARGRHRRRLHGHRRAARRARADDARLPDRGRVHRRGRRLGRARGAARRRRDPGRAALAAARARLRARPRAACRSASSRRCSRSARWRCSSPRRSRASRSRCARSCGGSSAPTPLIYGVLALRALRTFQLTRRIGDLAVVAGLVWLAIAVATYLLSPVWSVGFWSRARARAGRLPRRSRPRS